jgi:pyruvate dehydrogenase E1 component beta subunit
MARMSLVQAVREALRLEMERDPTVVLLGEDIGRNGGVFRATEGLLERFGPERVIDTPLAESGIVGTAIGMALGGLRPVAEIQFEGFLLPALDQLVSHAARFSTRSRGLWNVPLVVRSPWGGGIRAPEHHSDAPEALLAHVPGLKIAIPSTPHDAKGLLAAAIRDPGPVVFLEPKRIYRSVRQEVPDSPFVVPLGRARRVCEGRDVTVVTWGASVYDCLRAIRAEGSVSAELIDLRTLVPLDLETLARSVRKTHRAVVVHEAPRTGGFGAEIAARLQEECFLDLEAPVARVTAPDVVVPLYRLEKSYLPDPERIVQAIQETARF